MTAARPAGPERSQPPTATAPARFTFPPFHLHDLENGLRVYLAPYPRGPLVHLELILPGGAQDDRIDRAGLAGLSAAMIDEGTSTMSSQEISARVDQMGGYLSSQSDWDSMSLSCGCLASQFQAALGLMVEIATDATFPASELERLRSQQLARLERRRAQPSTQAADALAELIYSGSIYSLPVAGTAESVQAIDRDDVLATGARHLLPDRAALVAVGDLEPDSARRAIETAFTSWHGPRRPARQSIDASPGEGIRVHLIDRPGAPQTELWLGHPGVPRDHHERPGLAVLNSLLGGKFTSRINLNLRERLGITYGASSSFAQRRGAGPFVIEASVDNAAVGTAVTEILAEMRRVREDLVAQRELAETQSYLIGVFPYTLQRIEGLADRLGDLAVFELPRAHYADFFAAISAVEREHLRQLARDHLHPDRVAVAAVGPRDELESQLEGFGDLRFGPPETPQQARQESL